MPSIGIPTEKEVIRPLLFFKILSNYAGSTGFEVSDGL